MFVIMALVTRRYVASLQYSVHALAHSLQCKRWSWVPASFEVSPFCVRHVVYSNEVLLRAVQIYLPSGISLMAIANAFGSAAW